MTVAREWPCPMDLEKLRDMQATATGIEGFVFKMFNGMMIKCKTHWWRKQRHRSKAKTDVSIPQILVHFSGSSEQTSFVFKLITENLQI
jgi:hypothetical protein